MQEKIKYSQIMSLGFTEEEVYDKVYFQEYGFPYCIITKKLTKKIYLDWAKETQFAQLVRMKDDKECDIVKRMPIKNLEHLKEIIDFFTDKTVEKFNVMTQVC